MPVRLTPRPARLAITTMRPLPFFFMPGATARLAKNAPSTFTAWIARQSSSLTSSTGRLLRPRHTAAARPRSAAPAAPARALARAAPAARDIHQHVAAAAGLLDLAHEGVDLLR